MNAPTAASIAAKAEAVRIAEEMSAAESESAREEMSAAEAEALRIDEINAPAPAQLAAAPAPATDQLTPASAPAPANDDLCGAEESTSTPKDISDGVNISCSGDVEITEAPAPVPTQRPDMFSAAVVKYATTVTSWAEMGIPAAIVKKYLKDPTGTPSDAINATKAMAVAAAEAESAASAAAAFGAETAAETAAKASAVAEAEAASAAGEASACSRLPEGETADYC